MADLETIRKKLEKYIIENNHTFREISLKIGRKDSYIQQYIKYGFPKRLNEMDRKKICQILNIPEKELLDDELIKSAITPAPYEDEDIRTTNNDFISLDIHATRPNADIYQNIIGRMSLNFIEFGHWLSGNPFDLKILKFEGDYMEPTILNGSLIIFDSHITNYRGDGVYVIKIGEAVQVKRLQQIDAKTMMLKVDSPRYQDINSKISDITILGRALFQLTGRPL